MNVISPKKLIEVALPLDAINAASRREGYIYRGNPSALHKWWAQRPLAAARAVIFAQLVHDPEDLWRCQNPGIDPNQQHRGRWTRRRAEFFQIIEDLVKWENTTNEVMLEKARAEIRKAWQEACELNKHHPRARELFDPETMPGLHDPFAGSGAIPLEAQRLGLGVFASDLNPVAVLINKAVIEIPPRFADKPPVHPEARNPLASWSSAAGLAEDVRRYGKWMRDEAHKRIGRLYPPIEVKPAMTADRPDLIPYVGDKLTVIAWLWARTVRSPNPAFAGVEIPLVSTFIVSSKEGKEAYVQPVVGKTGYRFAVKVGKPPPDAKLGTRAGKAQDFFCLMSKTVVSRDYVRDEGKANRLGARLMAIVAEGTRGRIYLDPLSSHAEMAASVADSETVTTARSTFLSGSTPTRAMITGGVCSAYGLTTWGHLFSPRQLVALTTFSDLVGEAREQIRRDAVAACFADDDTPLDAGGTGARAYSEAVSVYLSFAIDKAAEYGCTIVPWYSKEDRPKGLFARQAIPMVWDYAEVNPFSGIGGTYEASVVIIAGALDGCRGQCALGRTSQANAVVANDSLQPWLISTDPPYYDNIGYADLSDFFYVWLRRTLRSVFPNLLATIVVPKTEELVATPYRHGTKERAEKFFLDGMTQVMHNLAMQAHPCAPLTIYYAFKQSETKNEGTNSTGWETFLEAVLKSGLSITGTWPMRTERAERSVSLGTNSLASSIILVCRTRVADAGTISRRQFVRMLNEALPLALDAMTRESEGLHSPVAPVDLSQAIIGPGMGIFSRYEAVLEADGTPMTVRTALQLINRFLAEDDFDTDTQFCLHWFEQHGWETGKFGEADTLARAKGTSVEGVHVAGVIESGGGNVRLLRWRELEADWDPTKDPRIPIWQALHQIILGYQKDGDTGAARLYAALPAKTEAARQLAYRLYTLCERKGWAEDARGYNEVVAGWTGIESAAAKEPALVQKTLFDNVEGRP